MSWASELAAQSNDPFLFLIIEGLGPLPDPSDDDEPWRLSTRTHDGATAAWYQPLVVEVPSELSQSIDLIDASVDHGAMAFRVADVGDVVTGWLQNIITASDDVGRLAANVATAIATAFHVNVITGSFSVGDVVYIGREAVRISVISVGGGAGGSDLWTVSRGHYQTEAAQHLTDANGGDGELVKILRYMRGRAADVYLGFYGETEPTTPIWRGVVDSIDLVDIGVYEFSLVDRLRRLRRPLLDRRYRGRARTAGNRPAVMVTHTYDGGGVYAEPDYAPAAGHIYYRAGDCLLRLLPGPAPGEWWAFDAELRGTVLPEPGEAGDGWQVFPAYMELGETHFVDDTGAASSHPIDVLLCIILSGQTGTGATNYDVLPDSCGLGYPVGWVDVQSFLDIRDGPLAGEIAAGLLFGWDERIKDGFDWLQEQICKVYGIFLHQDEQGRLALGYIRDAYPADSSSSLTEADIIPRSEHLDLRIAETVQRIVWEYDWSPGSGKYLGRVTPQLGRGEEWYPWEQDKITISAQILRGPEAQRWIDTRSWFFAAHWQQATPVLKISVPLTYLQAEMYSIWSVTHSLLPSRVSGSRGWITERCALIGRQWNFAAGLMELTLFWLDFHSRRSAHWAPAAVVVSWDLPSLTVTVTENTYSDGTAHPPIVADDTDGFTAGDHLLLIDQDGAVRSSLLLAERTTLASKTGTTLLVLDKAFTDDVGATVTPVAGDVVVFAPYSATITATMDDYAAMGDAGTVAGTGDAAYVFGA